MAHGIKREVVKIPETERGIVLLPNQWCRERSFDWMSRSRRRGLIAGGRWGVLREFWTGEEREVLRLNVSGSSNLPRLREIADALDQQFSFYNIDIPTEP